MTSNIEQFDSLTGQILATLYERFPVGTVLDRSKFANVKADSEDWLERFARESAFFSSTVQWLAHAGYLNFANEAGGAFYEAVLSAKGLEVLKATPASLKAPDGGASKTLGDYLVDGVKNGAADAMKKGAAYALSAGAALAWNAVLTAVR